MRKDDARPRECRRIAWLISGAVVVDGAESVSDLGGLVRFKTSRTKEE